MDSKKSLLFPENKDKSEIKNGGSELFVFAGNEVPTMTKEKKVKPWKFLIVDDEKSVHSMTKLVLEKFTYEDRSITFLNAYSGVEAQQVLADHPDIVIILLDVVMESEHAGLDLVEYIRETLENKFIRIILRTGQPGQAPEKSVILKYDINDYKAKTELTAQKLTTTIISSLRSYVSITTLAKLNEELEIKVQERTAKLRASSKQLRKSLEELKEGELAGKKIQFKLLPKPIWEKEGYEFSFKIIPSLYMSGDFIDYFEVNNEWLGFYIIDVAGHGVASAFITVLLKSFMERYLEDYHHKNNGLILDPAKLLEKLNNELLAEDLGKHLTIFFGLINQKDNSLLYANAGQFPAPIIWSDSKKEFIKSKGGIIGLFDNQKYHNQRLKFSDEFTLMIVSDGVLDLLNEMSLKKKLEIISDFEAEAKIGIEEISKRLGMKNHKVHSDDITFLLIKRKKKNG